MKFNEFILNEAYYNHKTKRMEPEYEDVEDDIRDGTYRKSQYNKGTSYQKHLQKQMPHVKLHADNKNIPGVKPDAVNMWHNKVMLNRTHASFSNKAPMDVHENRAYLKFKSQDHLNSVAERVNKSPIIETKEVPMYHLAKGKVKVHVHVDGLRVPVINGIRKVQHSYMLRHPEDENITPPFKHK